MEYGQRWAAGDKKSRAYTLKGKKKEDIAFQQTDCTRHHKKPLLIAEQYAAAGCIEAPYIRAAEFSWFCLVNAAAC